MSFIDMEEVNICFLVVTAGFQLSFIQDIFCHWYDSYRVVLLIFIMA